MLLAKPQPCSGFTEEQIVGKQCDFDGHLAKPADPASIQELLAMP